MIQSNGEDCDSVDGFLDVSLVTFLFILLKNATCSRLPRKFSLVQSCQLSLQSFLWITWNVEADWLNLQINLLGVQRERSGSISSTYLAWAKWHSLWSVDPQRSISWCNHFFIGCYHASKCVAGCNLLYVGHFVFHSAYWFASLFLFYTIP